MPNTGATLVLSSTWSPSREPTISMATSTNSCATNYSMPKATSICGGPMTSKTSSAERLAVLSRKIGPRSEEHTSELQSQSNLVCRLLLEKKKKQNA